VSDLDKASVARAVDRIYGLDIDRWTIPQVKLDLGDRRRTSLFPWRGQFSPQLVDLLLAEYAEANLSICDPFVGSGTTLFECARKSLPCCGTEVNPAAVTMASTCQFVSVPTKARVAVCRRARQIVEQHAAQLDRDGLFSMPSSHEMVASEEEVLRQMSVGLTDDPLVHNILANTVIRYSTGRRSEEGKPLQLLRAVDQHLRIIQELPYSSEEYKVFHSDARMLPLADSSIDLIITSPPYINVFNYHQNARQAMEIAGWDLLRVARSEIGSNRKHRANRFLTVIQYAIDMAAAVLEMRRVLRPGGRIIAVIGRESRIRRVSFENFAILGTVATVGAGLDVVSRQERKFTNRFGKQIYEDILHFTPSSGPFATHSGTARDLGIFFLERALPRSDGEVSENIVDAIEAATDVSASPLLEEGLAYGYGAAQG